MSSVALVMMAVRSPLRWLRGMLEDLYLKEKETRLSGSSGRHLQGQAPLFCLTRDSDHQPQIGTCCSASLPDVFVTIRIRTIFAGHLLRALSGTRYT